MRAKCLLLVFAIVFGLWSPALADDAGYLVGEGDVLKIMVYDHPDMTTIVRVSGGGTIAFPLIGLVQVKNLNVDQVARKIADKLDGDYIVRPQISVFVEEFRSKKVTIIGEVGRPGLYELSGSTTLMELISKAGGLTQNYGNTVTIHSKAGEDNSGEKTTTINLKDILENGGTSFDVPVFDGDSVVVSKASTFFVTGEVRKPDAYKFEDGTTVIKAVTKAGGFTNLASRKKVKVYRKVNGKEHVAEKVSMDMAILPGDVIVVPESFF
jgi:polysaccharide export outer membrane protein